MTTKKVLIQGSILLVSYFIIYYVGRRIHYYTLAYEGMITDKFIDSNRRGAPSINLVGSDGEKKKYIIENAHYYQIMSEGDMVVKKSGTFKHILIKNGDTIFFFCLICNPS